MNKTKTKYTVRVRDCDGKTLAVATLDAEFEDGVPGVVAYYDRAARNVKIYYVHEKFRNQLMDYQISKNDIELSATTTDWRISSKFLETLNKIENPEDIEILNHLESKKIATVVLADGTMYADDLGLKVLEDIRKPHKVLVIKNEKTAPYYFLIAGIPFKTSETNYYKFLESRIPVQSWMLEELEVLPKTTTASKKKESK